jgi:hypothetical protein
MDLYPEAFAAGQLIKKQSWLYKLVYQKAYSYKPVLLLALGKNQADYLKSSFGEAIKSIILPCGVFINHARRNDASNDRPSWKNENKIYLGYIGNIGEAHSVKFLKEVIRAIDTNKHRMILVAYGSRANEILEFANQHPEKVSILPFLKRTDLSFIDLHLASLKKEWLHVCVPSKIVSAVHMGAAFLFFGPQEGDSWAYLSESGWLIDEAHDLKAQINSFMKHLDQNGIKEKRKAAQLKSESMVEDTSKAYDQLTEFLKNSNRSD